MIRKKLLLTGAQGFVAGSVLVQAGDKWEVHGLSRGPEPQTRLAPGSWHWHQFDPLDKTPLTQLFAQLRPHCVVHTAAVADIDFCEKHPDLARAVNVELTRTLAELCTETGARFVFCSTDT